MTVLDNYLKNKISLYDFLLNIYDEMNILIKYIMLNSDDILIEYNGL
jgi:hypothetical protein